MQGIDDRVARLLGQIEWRLGKARERMGYLNKALVQQHPTRQFAQLKLRLEHAYMALLRQQRASLVDQRHRLRLCESTLAQHHPGVKITQLRERLTRLLENHQAAMRRHLLLARHQLSLHGRSLDTLSPLKTLARGFATVSKNENLVTSVKQLATGDDVRIRLADGAADAKIS
jgi:exodeoxyribonuclease VII large subunit